MNQANRLQTIVISALLSASSVSFAHDVEIARSVRKALPYLEREGVAWMEKRGCVSCHQIPFMVWSLSVASQAGFDIDAAKLRQWRTWSTDVVNFVKPEQKKDIDRAKTMSGNIDTMAAMLLAVDDDPSSEWRQSFSAGLAANQNDDGSWKSCGQLPAQKRPTRETSSVTAAWTLLALTAQGHDQFDADAALRTIDATTAAKSTEWWAARLLLADRLNENRKTEFQSALLERQNDDGGWGWITGDTSDALATGMAIYALRVTSEGANVDNALTRATSFLIDTQQEDGSWKVSGTKKSTQTKSTPTSSYWGTAWTVIGLLEVGADPHGGAGT